MALRRTPLKLVPPADHSDEPGYKAWKAPVFGECACCGDRGRLERHHVISEQHLRAMGAPVWDLRGSLLLGVHCRCHSRHTTAAQRISVTQLSDENVAYAAELLGEGVGGYLSRYYAP